MWSFMNLGDRLISTTHRFDRFKTVFKTIQEIEKISDSIDKLNDDIQAEISKTIELPNLEHSLKKCDDVIEINDD